MEWEFVSYPMLQRPSCTFWSRLYVTNAYFHDLEFAVEGRYLDQLTVESTCDTFRYGDLQLQ